MTNEELSVGQQINLIRYTDNNDIEITKEIEKVCISAMEIKFKGIKGWFNISMSGSNVRFTQGNKQYELN